MLDKESTTIKIGSASYIRPIINLISDSMWEYEYQHLKRQDQSKILLFVHIEFGSNGIKVHYFRHLNEINNFG